MDFSASILNNIQRIKDEANNQIVNTAIKLFTFAVDYSPTPIKGSSQHGDYSKGLFINQWYPQQNGYSQEHSSQKDDNGGDSRSRISILENSKAFLGKDGNLTLSNNTEYARNVEDLGWKQGEGTNGWIWSGNAVPYAPVQNAMVRIKSVI